tara:strand:- start:662 stop:787 length:126 start_codon:yes stop_codon:yes gene_type:complete
MISTIFGGDFGVFSHPMVEKINEVISVKRINFFIINFYLKL